MASEIRHVLFQPAEVVLALGEYYRRLKRAVPSGVVLEYGPIRCAPGEPVRFRMKIGPNPDLKGLVPTGPGGDVEHHMVVEGADLAAALILACKSQRIPLPAKSAKTLQVFGDQVCLAFSMTPHVLHVVQDKLWL